MRIDGSRTIVAAMNADRGQWHKGAVIRVPAGGRVTEWNCLTSQRYTIPARERDGVLEFDADFPPSGEHVYVIADEQPVRGPAQSQYVQKKVQVCEGPFEYTLNEDNVCVLDMARHRIGEDPWQDVREVLKIDQAVRDHFALARRGGEMVQPWFSRKYWPAPEVKGQVTMVFAFDVETIPAGPVALCIEHPEHFTIALNGRSIESRSDGWWIDPAIAKVVLPNDAFVKGENSLELRMAFSEDKNIEAVYLIGRFGVRVQGTARTLCELPKTLAAHDVTSQGLPFYSGAIRYQVPVKSRSRAGEHVFLELPGFEGAAPRSPPRGTALAWWPGSPMRLKLRRICEMRIPSSWTSF